MGMTMRFVFRGNLLITWQSLGFGEALPLWLYFESFVINKII